MLADLGLPQGAATASPLEPRLHRVVSRARETADTVTLALEPVDGTPDRFEPGQFNMLYAYGIGEVPISLSGDPTQEGPLVHTIRSVGAVTRALCEMGPGAVLGVRGPFGRGWDLTGATGRDVLIVAGGIGLAPLRPAVLAVLADRGRFGKVHVLLGARSPKAVPFTRELARWRSRFDVNVDLTVDIATPGWRGQVGVVTKLVGQAAFDPAASVALVCGPELMMRLTADLLLDRGMAAQDVQLSIERNMQCGVGLCGHCQLGPFLLCRDGPVVTYDRLRPLLRIREL